MVTWGSGIHDFLKGPPKSAHVSKDLMQIQQGRPSPTVIADPI